MASFNDKEVNVSAPDYTGSSRGFTSVKKGVADLFSNVTGIGVAAVNVVHNNNLENQQIDAQEGVDKILQDFGFRTFANDTTGTPQEIKGYASQLERVKKAWMNGSLRESAFQMRVDSLARKMRAQYPGYTEEIDTVISSTLNRSTANDLRKQLNQEWAAEQEDLSLDDKKYAQEIVAWRDDGTLGMLFPDFSQREAAGKPYSKEEVRYRVGLEKARLLQLDNKKKEVEYKTSEGTLLDREREDLGYEEAATITRQFYEAGLNGFNFDDVSKSIQNKPLAAWTADELATTTASVNTATLELSNRIDKALSDKTYDKLTAEEKKNIKAKAMQPIDALKQALVDKDMGLLAQANNFVKLQGEVDLANYYKAIDPKSGEPVATMARQRALTKSLYGDDAVALLDGSPVSASDTTSRRQSYVNNVIAHDILNGTSPVKALDAMKKTNPTAVDGKVVRESINKTLRVLTDSKTKPEGKAQLIDTLFGEGNAGFLAQFSSNTNTTSGKSDQELMFEQLMSPSVTAAVKEAAQGNPQLLDKYKAAMGNAFTALFNKDIATATDVSRFSDLIAFQYDPKTAQFITINKADGGKKIFTNSMAPGPMGVFYGMNEQWKLSAGKKAVDKMNGYLRNLKPAMEAAGVNTEDALSELLEVNGVEREGSIFSQMQDALRQAMIDLSNSPSGKTMTEGATNRKTNAIANTIEEVQTERQRLRNYIGKAESADYNTLYGGKVVPLTSMTIREAMNEGIKNKKKMDAENGNNKATTVIGKYQVKKETLQEAVDALGLDMDTDLFSPEVQDQIADWLIDTRADGGKDAKKLARIWASLPFDNTNLSYYDGDGVNKARVKYAEFKKYLTKD